tara:strand:+ start:1408 stop:1677 length:270 start_codon:yes stop_codon:yes gene_type:complete
MMGHAVELEKGFIYSTEWEGPFHRVLRVKRGKVGIIVTQVGGEKETLGVLEAVRYFREGVDPKPIALDEDYEAPVQRKAEVPKKDPKKK